MLAFYLSLTDNPEDKRKIEILYRTHRRMMMRAAIKILEKQEWAEDAVHESILKLIENLDRIDAEEMDSPRTKAFIYTITKNTALNFLKKEQRYCPEEQIEIPADTLIDQVLAREYLEKINALPSIYRDPLLLSAYYGLSNRKIARILRISEQLVGKRIKKARVQLSEGEVAIR